MTQLTVIYCNCSYYDIVPQETKSHVMTVLDRNKIPVHAFSDLCETVVKRPGDLAFLNDSREVLIIACYPRAVRALLAYGGYNLDHKVIHFFNMRTDKPNERLEDYLRHIDTEDQSDESSFEFPQERNEWIPWYPVIDYDRCIQCGQCMNFCLFGVYALDQKKNVKVVNPSGCKTNCPACARLCPRQAIIFPKHQDEPINGSNQNIEKQNNQIQDIQLLEQIRKRNIQNDLERHDIKALQRALHIPPEVLASLSPQQLNRIKTQRERK